MVSPTTALAPPSLWLSFSRPARCGRAAAAVHRRPVRLCVRAGGLLETPRAVMGAVQRADGLFQQFDKDSSGELSVQEVVQLLNSDEYRQTFSSMGVKVHERSVGEVKPLFDQLDQDKSGALSRQEFLVLWTSLAKDRVCANPRVAALGLCSFLDENGDGKLAVSELKRFLPLLGLAGVALSAMPLPDWVTLDYRDILGEAE
mmetsp:Transcript_34045/g.60791  ORF Transcript_34045/g.60791 Transcript_34045/m.60791 type:complete len:202 (-) Transcript_34045:37-642(-)